MKSRLSTILTVILVAALILGAVCIGGVKGYQEEREELLLTCMETHVKSGAKLADSIQDCEEDAADFDARLKHKWMGRIAGSFGVMPVSDIVKALHAQLLSVQSSEEQYPGLWEHMSTQIGELLEDKVDTKLSFSKIFWTIFCLSAIFGKKGRKKGLTLGKLLAGFGLFNMWKKK